MKVKPAAGLGYATVATTSVSAPSTRMLLPGLTPFSSRHAPGFLRAGVLGSLVGRLAHQNVFESRDRYGGYGVGLTRRKFVALGGAAFVSLLAPRVSAGAAGWASRGREVAAGGGYVSRPDLNPPVVEVVVPAQGTAPGYLFLAPFDITAASGTYTSTPASESHSGPLIVDRTGQPVWFRPLTGRTAMDVRVQRYRGPAGAHLVGGHRLRRLRRLRS